MPGIPSPLVKGLSCLQLQKKVHKKHNRALNWFDIILKVHKMGMLLFFSMSVRNYERIVLASGVLENLILVWELIVKVLGILQTGNTAIIKN